MVNGKWYIGKTNDVFTRYAQHKEGNGSAWTRIHKIHFQKTPIPSISQILIDSRHIQAPHHLLIATIDCFD